jgi:hypothetical protein
MIQPAPNSMGMGPGMHPSINLGFGMNPGMNPSLNTTLGQQLLPHNVPHSMNYNGMGHMPPNPANFGVAGGLYATPHGHAGYPPMGTREIKPFSHARHVNG